MRPAGAGLSSSFRQRGPGCDYVGRRGSNRQKELFLQPVALCLSPEFPMKQTILVVDDEDSIRASLTGILEDEGYETVVARNGEEALAIVQKEMPDLVLLDIWMPKLDGMETLRR